MKPGPKPVPVQDRFWDKVNKAGAVQPHMRTACWLWTASISKRHGYGKIGCGGHGNGWDKAHRISWMLHHGPIPAGQWVLHRCDVRHCVNPDHLFLGTALENNRDTASKGRFLQQRHPERCRRERCLP